ncbi:MAG TPA: type II secretion system protein [Verrucomicrobiales bacterium]|nr:type II secretion system protein [Verrucomicrobiales bacterium]HIL68999.1 type II secretion system protein [Verrucomicrobiota bacterium]
MIPATPVAEFVRIPMRIIQGNRKVKLPTHTISKQDSHENATTRRNACPPMGFAHPGQALKAFTLVELMTVIAISGILASLLLPVISKSKSSAQRVQCTSNLRQLGFAVQLYWNDFEQKPFAYSTERTSKGIRYWFGRLEKGVEGQRKLDHTQGVLWPYIKGRGIERCPSFDYSSPLYKSKAITASYGYGYNLHIAQKSESGLQSQGRFRMTQLKSPSGSALFADAAQINDFQPPASSSNPMLEEFYYINFNPGDYPNVHFRHQIQANSLFCDGHVSNESPLPDSLDQRLPTMNIGRMQKEKLLIQ